MGGRPWVTGIRDDEWADRAFKMPFKGVNRPLVHPTQWIDNLELDREIVVHLVWGVWGFFVASFRLKILPEHFQKDPEIVSHTYKTTPENFLNNSLNRLFVE